VLIRFSAWSLPINRPRPLNQTENQEFFREVFFAAAFLSGDFWAAAGLPPQPSSPRLFTAVFLAQPFLA